MALATLAELKRMLVIEHSEADELLGRLARLCV